MSTPELERLTLGFIPLLDAALPIIAREAGFFADEGLEVALSRENAWSTLRDKVASGLLDGAHMLSPLPLAMSLGLSRAPCETLAPFILGRGGNTIVLSRRWSEDMDDIGEDRDPRDNARRFAARLHDHRGDPPRLAMVYPYSCQHYQLREWLASADIDIDRQVALGALPPPRMVEALESGEIDGFCVGEPWGSLARHRDLGRIVASGAQLWPAHPEKVLGVTASWALRYPTTLAAMIRALHKASQWLDASPEHARRALGWLALPPYLDRSVEHLETLAPDAPPAWQSLVVDPRPTAEIMSHVAEHLDQHMRESGRVLDMRTLSTCYSPAHFDAATHQ
ncbi:CmpA/NrtA family ABC transporter substrate-binding protein [Halomonas elongata]|uniref:CmpA/NrtA family ABC transporter substrate-binding protein n=1 Tax=Halomonas elongata TaxID=2746 RepID=UPI00186B7F54|nr:CmpA/NrtA family ABC transporter substrate-binding protein [Halomonas elongata]MBW5799970.1 ABC transporter substrate-binding protein [Halomonas elongata]